MSHNPFAALLLTPAYAVLTYGASGASWRRGAVLGAIFIAWGAVATVACLADAPARLGIGGGLVIGASWIVAIVLPIAARRWLLPGPLDQRWLVGLQIARVIGGVFLIEMTRGNLPGAFAYPAGVGDLVVGVTALFVVLRWRKEIPRSAVWLVLILGVIDFVSAFFFGFTSSAGPLRLFAEGFDSQLDRFPTGMIPLFLVPYAWFFHTLSWLELRRARVATA